MNPKLLRAVLLVLSVRAIFIAPAPGSEYGPAHRRVDSALKRIDAIRPTRLRFTRPLAPAVSIERVDCVEGGDDDDDRTAPALSVADPRFFVISPHLWLPARPTPVSMPRSPARLRC